MPRDPQRIGQILQLIGAIWLAHPDLRFGQLIADASIGLEQNIFNYEDTTFEADLRAFAQKYNVKV